METPMPQPESVESRLMRVKDSYVTVPLATGLSTRVRVGGMIESIARLYGIDSVAATAVMAEICSLVNKVE